MNDKKLRYRYQLNDDSVKKIMYEIMDYDHVTFDDDNFDEILFKKYYWKALDEFWTRQRLLEIIWKN
jgi:hypothetical protein